MYLVEDNSLHHYEIAKIKKICYVTDGQHGYYQSDSNSDIRMLAAKNCKNYFANTEDALLLAKWVDEKNKRSSLQCGDIILSTRGSVGCCAIVYKEVLPANINQDVARIKLLDTNNFIPEFIITFLNSKYGQHWMQRNQTGMVQQGLPLDKVRDIPIPLIELDFQLRIENIVKTAHSKLEESKLLYATAENQLLEELGLKDWKPENQNVNVKTFKESFLSSGRLDAEYYQSKYDEIEEHIKRMHHDVLDNLCLLVNHGMQPPYIENGEMRVFSQKWIKDSEIDYSFIDDINEPRTSLDFATSNPNYVCRKNDIVHYSVGANIGYCHTYLSNIPMMPGSFITLIRANENKINPIYLGMVLNSVIGRIQSEKRKSGTAQPYVYPKDIREFLIPILPTSTQDDISSKIQKSFALKAESKRLLEEAKLMVEQEIEKGGK